MKIKPINPRLAAALDYLARGWSPLALCPHDHKNCSDEHKKQCNRPGKRPLWKWDTFQTQRPSEREIRLAFGRMPNANLGVCMGQVSGLLGLDIDGAEGIALLEKLSNGVRPETVEFITHADRRRLLFAHPSTAVQNKVLPYLGSDEALRIMSTGSQTVMPPSTHPTGEEYRWVYHHAPGEIDLAPCPPWLLDLLASFGVNGHSESAIAVPTIDNRVKRARAYLEKCDPCISGSRGSAQAFKIACKLVHGFHLSEEEAFQLLMENYNGTCEPPWSEKEWQHHLKNAREKGHCKDDFMADETKPTPPLQRPAPLQPSPEQVPRLQQRPTINAKKVSEITSKPVDFLWQDWLPAGKLVMLDGDPGLGKSTILLDLAARISMGAAMPDGIYTQQGHVLILSGEDDEEDTIKPRLEAAGCDQGRVECLFSITDAGGERPICFPQDLKWVEELIRERKAKLLIIDPLFAFIADMRSDIEIRKLMMQLRNMAKRTGCCIIGLRHLNKSSNTKALYRGSGHIAYSGSSRIALIVGEDPEDRECRVLAVSKVNLSKLPQALRFRLTPTENGRCRVEWLGVCDLNADDLVAPQPTEEQAEVKEEKKTKMDNARLLLQSLLQINDRLPIKACLADAASAGISSSTAHRAARQIGVITTYYDPQLEGQHTWRLPGGGKGD